MDRHQEHGELRQHEGHLAAPGAARAEDTLRQLEVIADERRRTITRTQTAREQARLRFERTREELRSLHHNANRVLVEAIEQAHKEGIPKALIAARIGMSAQGINQMRRTVERWDDGR